MVETVIERKLLSGGSGSDPDRIFQIGKAAVYDTEFITLQLWNGSAEADLRYHDSSLRRFRIPKQEEVVAVAAMVGFFNRRNLPTYPIIQELELDLSQVGHPEDQSNASSFSTEQDVLTSIARGRYENHDLDVPSREQEALAPLLRHPKSDESVGLYYQDDFVVLALRQVSLSERQVVQRAKFTPDEVSAIAGAICRQASEPSRQQLSLALNFQIPVASRL